MKTLIKNANLQPLEDREAMEISGGSGFAYDLGRGFRYLGIAIIYGVPAALADAGANSVRCRC